VLETLSLPFAIATSSEAAETSFCLRAAGLDGRFPVRVTRDQIAHGKPAPDIYLEAGAPPPTDPAECVALEGLRSGILSASRAGMVPLLIPDGVRHRHHGIEHGVSRTAVAVRRARRDPRPDRTMRVLGTSSFRR
jgi:beta-phosphoglucomutase-like phosphatase (HAD superfamily)